MSNTVGEALRAFRSRQGLTLFDVARLSGNEFKVSSLGAYERGDRSITYERLQRLALVYGVDVQSLLPREPEREIDLVGYERRGGIVIDLSRFRNKFDARAGAVMDFGTAIKTLRKGSDSSVIVVRRSDAAFLATAMDCDPDAIDDILIGQPTAEQRNQEWVPATPAFRHLTGTD
jgi:transcriptional regulator with XRE-family HTH domain